MELKGRVAVITGSSGRLGGGIAVALAQAGCLCVCHYNSNEQSAQTLVARIKDMGVKALAVQADLTKQENIENLFEKSRQLGTPQILINSAAVFSRGSLGEVTFEKARQVLDINLISSIMTSQVFAKQLKDKFGDSEETIGKIINISGAGGIKPWGKGVLYCCSKAGLIGATKSLAKELAPSVLVNSVSPGMVTWPKSFTDEAKERQLAFIPAGRIAESGDITAAIKFLLENDYITGEVLSVDGGRCI